MDAKDIIMSYFDVGSDINSGEWQLGCYLHNGNFLSLIEVLNMMEMYIDFEEL